MNEYCFSESRPFSCPALQVQRRLHVDEWQDNELCKTTRLGLEIPNAQQVPRDMVVLFNVPIHDGRCRIESHFMGRFHHFEPLRSIDLVRAQGSPNFIIKDLCRRTRQRTQAGFFQLSEKVGNRDTKCLSTLPDFKR